LPYFQSARTLWNIALVDRYKSALSHTAYAPAIRLRGDLLKEIGGRSGSLVTVSITPETIFFQLTGDQSLDWVKYARTHHLLLTQIEEKQCYERPIPSLLFSSSRLQQEGWHTGDVFVIEYDDGRLTLKKRGWKSLGFS
jgi:hypothetical protein